MIDMIVHPDNKMPVLRTGDIPDWAGGHHQASALATSLLGFSPWEVLRGPALSEGDTGDWWLPPGPRATIVLPGQEPGPAPAASACIPLWLPMGDLLAVRLLASALPEFDPHHAGLSFYPGQGPNWILEQPDLIQIFFPGEGTWETSVGTCILRGFGVPDLIQNSARRPDVLAQILTRVWAVHPTYTLPGGVWAVRPTCTPSGGGKNA